VACDTHIFLIHGVGYFTKGRIKKDSEILFKSIPSSKVSDICWSEKVVHPMIGGSVDHDYLENLGRAIHRSSSLGFESYDGQSFRQSIFTAVADYMATILRFITLSLPLFIFFYFGAALTGSFYKEIDSIWGFSIESSPWGFSIIRSIFGPHYVYDIASLMLETALSIALISIILVLITSMLIKGPKNGLIEGVRRVTLIVAWPFIFLSVFIATFSLKTIFFAVIIIFGTMVVQSSLVYATVFDDFSTATSMLTLPVVVLVVIGLLKMFGNKFGEQLKIIGDIFFYLGDEKYKDALINELATLINNEVSQATKKIMLVGHSLGSVIAVDYLLSQPGLRQKDLTLVTMGSPLMRLFTRFFSSSRAPVGAGITQIVVDHDRFRWLNIYRPFDFVGGNMQFAGGKHNSIYNVSTKQIRDPLSSHVGYWRDEKVGDIITSFINNGKYFDKTLFLKEDCALPTNHINQQSSPALYSITGMIASYFLVFGYSIWFGIAVSQYFTPQWEKEQIEARYKQLAEHGILTTALVTPFKTVDKLRDNGITNYYPNYKIHISFTDELGIAHEIKFVSKLWIDMKKLSDDFINPRLLDEDYSRTIYAYDKFETQLEYHPQNIQKFALSEYKTDVPVSDNLYPISEFFTPLISPIISAFITLLLFGRAAVIFTNPSGDSYIRMAVEGIEDILEGIFD
jgi:hypothetical protein